MTKAKLLNLLRLLSALEATLFAAKANIPDYLSDSLSEAITDIQKELQGE